MQDGTRKITAITEVQGMEGDVIVLQDIFIFEQTGIENGKIVGRMKPTGIRPKFIETLRGAEHLPAAEHLRHARAVLLASTEGRASSCSSRRVAAVAIFVLCS